MRVLLLAAVVLALAQAPPTYDAARAAAVKTCDAIDANASQSGLAFNPAGYRSFYLRSECLQKAAVQFRDVTLCDRVKQRRALFWSSWGYSPDNCRKLVAEAGDADRKEIGDIRRRFLATAMVLRDFRVERNGNGRDYDLIPSFDGSDGHSYTLTIEILSTGGRPVPIHTNGYFVDPRSALSVYIRLQDIKARVPGFEPGRSYSVRASTTFSVPASDSSRFMSDAFLEGAFPLRERTRSVVKDIRF
jgi:hypothetical protein